MKYPVRFCTLLALLILFLSYLTYPQTNNLGINVKFKHLTSEQGLLNSFINCILQDSKGFVWIGTGSGLYRYDGIECKVYNYSREDHHSISNNLIFSAFEDRSGNLWFGTDGGGLNKYSYEQDNFIQFINDPRDSNSISSNSVYSICEDKYGALWVGTTDQGLNKFDPVNKNFERYKNDPEDSSSLSNNTVSTIYNDSKGNIWIGTIGGGLNRYNRKTQKFNRYINNPKITTSLSNNNITDITEDKFGFIWLSTLGGGLNKFYFVDDKHPLVFYNYKNDSNSPITSGNNISSIYINKDDVMWVGAWSEGLTKVISSPNSKFTFKSTFYKQDPYDNFSLNNNSISCLFEDSQGLLWIGTWGSGLNILDTQEKPFRFYNYRPNDPFSLSSKRITSIFEDKRGVLWIGTWDGGLNKMSRNTNKFTHYQNHINDQYSISDNSVWVVYEDRSGILWVGTWNGGLNSFDRNTGRFFAYKHNPTDSNSISDNRILSIREDKSGTLWVGTYFGGLNRFNRESGTFSHFRHNENDPYSISNDFIELIYEDRSGVLWLCTNPGGLDYFDNQRNKFFHFRNDPDNSNSISSNRINFIYEDESGILWIGTLGGGLNKLDKENKQFKRYRIKDGLPSDYIAGILGDNHGNLWISTYNGLTKFNPKTEKFRNYNVADGLPSNEFEHNSCCKSKTGEFIYGGNDGMIIFYPDSIKDNPNIPPVYITDFFLFGKPASIGYDSVSKRTILNKSIIECEEIKLNYDDNVFSLKFAALDYHSPMNNKYAYILEGFDRGWNYTDAKQNLATYTNLNPGEYIFKVKGSNNDGLWNETGASIKIIILPPWWKTTWAYTFYLLLLIGAIYFVWKLQIKRIKNQHEFEMSKFEAQKLHEVDELKSRFFTNISHEFRTPLTLILGPVKQIIEKLNDGKMKDDLSIVHRNANKLLGLVNQLLDISKIESGNMKLQTSPQNVVQVVKVLVLSFTSYAERKKITLTFNSSENEIIVYLDKDKVEKIITNLLSNAFKFTPDGGRIEVSLTRDIKSVKVSVSDDGIGIPKQNMDKIFDRFYQVDGSHTRKQEGTGIGLSLTKELVELHKGKIEVESEEGKGATFIISLLLGSEHLHRDEISEPLKDEEKISITPSSSISIEELKSEDSEINSVKINQDLIDQSEKQLLLLVEDNSDVRNYIKDNLAKDYRILEAVDGADGWEKSIENTPDLIVSDVMMPKMDGFELCKKLKTDERTSHIPVILLTAKAAKEDKLGGYEIGADDYIMKPFEPDELRARIKNLIEQRKRLQNHFRKQGLSGIEHQKITSFDKRFLQKLLDVIKNKLSDSEFNVEYLADELAISRSVLQRKVYSLTGESPVELIRRIRLNRAAELIENKFGNISEIALEVGFSNPAYFADCFKKQYGVTPSQYQRGNKSS